MSVPSLRRGAVVLVRLDPIEGHEQAGVRPAIIVSDPMRVGEGRFPLVVVVPVTRTHVRGPWSVRLPSGAGGLRAESTALIDQIRSLDRGRILRVYDALPDEHLARIGTALRDCLML